MKFYYAYMMASRKHEILYLGVINNLAKRVYEHKAELFEGFPDISGCSR